MGRSLRALSIGMEWDFDFVSVLGTFQSGRTGLAKGLRLTPGLCLEFMWTNDTMQWP